MKKQIKKQKAVFIQAGEATRRLRLKPVPKVKYKMAFLEEE